MEKELPNDRLEEFLRKSLEGYTESPSADLWSKIEGNLELEPVAHKYIVLKRWWIGVAAAAVFGLFIGQHLYFDAKLQQISKKLSNLSLPSLQVQTPPRPVASKEADGKEVPNKVVSSSFDGSVATTGPNPNLPINEPTSKTNNDASASPAPETNDTHDNQTQPAENTALSTTTTDEGKAVAGASAANPYLIATLPLSSRSMYPLNKGIVFTSKPSALLPHTYHSQRVVSAGMRVMPMVNWERTRTIKPVNPQPGSPPPPKSFNDANEVRGNSLTAGTTVELKISNHWSVVSGMDYRQTEFASTHRSQFKFKDGKPPQGGPHHHQSNFQYQLNTPIGATSLELRVEEKDTTQPVPDEEVLAFEVKTNQSISHLSVPFSVRFGIDQGRFSFYVKGGTALNLLLDYDFRVSEVSSLNPRFGVRKGQPAGCGKQNLRAVSLDYLAAAGIAYKVNPTWSLHLEPAFMGNLTSRHKDSFIQSANYMAGLSGGVSFYF